MSNLSKAERDKLPASDFALPSQRLYPILDQDDVDSAARLIGKHPDAKAGVIRLAKRKGLKVPDAWQTADHSLGPAVTFANGVVTRSGKLWEAGDYPDKAFGMTPEELYAAIQDFEPAAIIDTHANSVFNGRLGKLVSVDVADDGWTLTGTAEVPEWVNEAFPDDLPVSVGWNRETKRIDHLALVTDPRVSDAALSAAFAAFAKRHDTPHGQMALQEMHDAAARNGAVCKAPTANMASRHEASATQQIHDIAATHGAVCASTGNRGGSPWFSSGRNRMSWAKNFGTWVKGGMNGDPPEPEPENPTPPTQPEPTPAGFSTTATTGGALLSVVDPKVAALEADVAAMKAENTRLRAERIQAEAVGFAETEIAAHRAMPAERESLIAVFAQCATDDATHGVVTFAAGATKSRTQLLRESAAARPAHVLTQEMLPPGTDAQVLFNQMTTQRAGEQKPPTAERKAELLAMTPLGQSVAASRNGNQN